MSEEDKVVLERFEMLPVFWLLMFARGSNRSDGTVPGRGPFSLT